MTFEISTGDIVRRLESGASVPELARTFGVSQEVIRYRLRTTGRRPADYRYRRTKEMRLLEIKEFLEQQRDELKARMSDQPGPKLLDRLGQLTDFILTLEDLTT